MTVTVRDDDTLRTHDEAADLLRACVPGARVSIARPRLRQWAQNNSERSRGYTISLERLGSAPCVVLGSYSLPAPAAQIARDARTRVEAAVKAAQPR